MLKCQIVLKKKTNLIPYCLKKKSAGLFSKWASSPNQAHSGLLLEVLRFASISSKHVWRYLVKCKNVCPCQVNMSDQNMQVSCGFIKQTCILICTHARNPTNLFQGLIIQSCFTALPNRSYSGTGTTREGKSNTSVFFAGALLIALFSFYNRPL